MPPYMKRTIKTLLFFWLFFPGIFIPPCFATEPWPLSSTWKYIPKQNDWNSIRDYTGDQSPTNADISSHGDFKNITIGEWNSVAFYSNGTTAFFRFLLSDNPLAWNNTQNTYQIDSRSSDVILIDTNRDNVPDWVVAASKSNRIMLFQGTSSSPSRTIPLGPITKNGAVYTDNTSGENYLRVTDTGVPSINVPGQSPNMHYLDIQVPLSWFTNMNSRTFFRPFYGTSNNDNNINKDYMIGNSANFNMAPAMSMGNPGVYGAIYDTRDTTPASNGGIWFGNETMIVTGYGWPSNTALTVQIFTPDGSTNLWQGLVYTNAAGEIAPTSTWPISLTAPPGIYRINVVYPTTGVSILYDTFEVKAPYISFAKTVTPAEVLPLAEVTYSIGITNTGNVAANMTSVTDTLPDGFTYKAGSTTGFTTVNPTVTGRNLIWPGTWTLPAGGSQTLSFKALTANQRGIYTNQISASGTNFGPYASGNTAPVKVIAPAISLTKIKDKDNAPPGGIITYGLNYINQGDAPAGTVIFLDKIPENTTYVPASAAGTGVGIQYSHDGGSIWNNVDTAPVTDIKWTLTAPLQPNAGGSLSFKVIVK